MMRHRRAVPACLTLFLLLGCGTAWAADPDVTAKQGGDDPGVLGLSLGAYTVNEGAGTVTITVRRTGGDDGAVSVHYATAGGTAVSGTDFTPASGTLNWADNDDDNKTFTVAIINDNVDENDESFNVTLSDVTGATIDIARRTAIVTVQDNDGGGTAPCVEGPTTLCLNNDRFKAEVAWRIPDGTQGAGQAVPVPTAPDSGLFYFFDPANIEMLIKVLNACPVNNRFWVFYAATTNVQFTLTVTDTETGAVKVYFNPLNQAAPPIQDTSAFATCP